MLALASSMGAGGNDPKNLITNETALFLRCC